MASPICVSIFQYSLDEQNGTGVHPPPQTLALISFVPYTSSSAEREREREQSNQHLRRGERDDGGAALEPIHCNILS
jgi:hypothetical protein